MEAYGRLDALAQTLAEIEPEKFGDTLADIQDIYYPLVEGLVERWL